MSELTVLEKATLQALAGECGYSLHGHASTEDVTRHSPGHLKGNAKKALQLIEVEDIQTYKGLNNALNAKKSSIMAVQDEYLSEL